MCWWSCLMLIVCTKWFDWSSPKSHFQIWWCYENNICMSEPKHKKSQQLSLLQWQAYYIYPKLQNAGFALANIVALSKCIKLNTEQAMLLQQIKILFAEATSSLLSQATSNRYLLIKTSVSMASLFAVLKRLFTKCKKLRKHS